MALNSAMERFQINDTPRMTAFLAQVGHESGQLTRLTENLNYSAKRLMQVWPRRFPSLERARAYEKNPQKLANLVYAGRLGNGGEGSGDGWRFRGRGLIQLTGSITSNRPGTVSYIFTRSDSATDTVVKKQLFRRAGTLPVSTTWTLGGATLPHYTGWQAIKVLSPNPMTSAQAPFELRCDPPLNSAIAAHGSLRRRQGFGSHRAHERRGPDQGTADQADAGGGHPGTRTAHPGHETDFRAGVARQRPGRTGRHQDDERQHAHGRREQRHHAEPGWRPDHLQTPDRG
ncbi:chitinase-like protein [Pelobacter propionicus DSM 2379]|uniref:Chitinase-like protein n=2 Tax=Pelobacter propionicus TaxID=29543 RepID=A1ATB7_PELPD|nr:chitinase-like protein [Pelobacter propionicus DSM 2379]